MKASHFAYSSENRVRTTYQAKAASMLSLAFALSLSTQALAQADPSPSVASDAGSADAGDIIVTARHRGESLQNVPLSVSAFSGAQLEAQGVTTLKDLNHAIPGLQYSDRGNLQTELTIRGVGGDARNAGVDSGVGMYIDGVYVARTSGYNSDLSDVERVEVLRGPQGTLFGKNTIGGVINVTTKKPSEDLKGFVYASYANYNAIRTQASISVPLTSNLFAKVTTATWDRDGYIRNIFDGRDYNNEDRRGGRVQLRWLASDALEINANADVTRDRRRGVLNQVGSPAGPAAPFFTGNRFQLNADQRNEDNRDMWGASITADYTFGNGMVLSSISGYRKIDILVYSDVDQLPIDIAHSGPFTDKSRMFSQELRLVSPAGEPLRYVGGLYYFHQKAVSDRYIFLGGNFAASTLTGANTDSYAGYVNADYELLESLTLTGGIRYTNEKKTGSLIQVRPPLFSYSFPNLRRRDSNISWTGSLRYEFSRYMTGYASVSRGYKSGGFNLDTAGAVNLVASDLIFRPENVTNYEVGLKGRTADNRARFSLAVFNLEYKDKQVSQFIGTDATAVPSNKVTNAGQARIKGFEVEVSVKPFAGFTLSGNASYLHARYTSFASAAAVGGRPVSYTGNRIERTPDVTVSGTAEYRHAAPGGELVGAVTVSHIGETFLQPDANRLTYQPGYTLLDAKLGFEATNGVTISLWGKNLTQKQYITFGRFFAGLNQVVYGEPRTYGVDARYRF